MASTLLRRAALLAGGLTVGVVSAQQYRAATYDERAYPYGTLSDGSSARGKLDGFLVERAEHDPARGDMELLSAYLLAPSHARRRAIMGRLFGQPASAAPCPVAQAQEPASAANDALASSTPLPKDTMSRFLMYAHKDPETGEYVQGINSFVACVLLVDPAMLEKLSPAVTAASASAPASASATTPLSTPVADGEGGAARPVKLPEITEKRLRNFFHFVDVDDSGTVNYAEFVVMFSLLSTRRRTLRKAFELFQSQQPGEVDELGFARLLNTIMLDPAVQVHYSGPVAQTIQPGDTPTTVAPAAAAAASTPPAAPLPNVDALAAASEAGRTWRARRTRRWHQKDFTFSAPSSRFWEAFHQTLPTHELPPPGSTHHGRSWLRWLTGSSSAGGERPAATWSRDGMRDLKALNARNRVKDRLCFDAFWHRVDFMRWELRAIEFSTFDPANTGFISIRELRRILTHRANAATLSSDPAAADESDSDAARAPAIPLVDENARLVSWKFYQTVFDIIRESDVTLPALQLAINAAPPVPQHALVNGAIPDGKLGRSRARVRARAQKKKPKDDEAKETGAPVELVRPTALTWRQFNHVLRVCKGIPRLKADEQQLFFQLFDEDHSGTITPAEFTRLCELRRSFFVTSLPRFDEPHRNTVQQFFYCMQQLD